MRASRQALGLNATQLANQIGVSRSRLANWEAGTSKVDIEVLLELKAIYGITLDWIFGGDLSSLKPDLAAKIHTHMSATTRADAPEVKPELPPNVPTTTRRKSA